MEKIVELISQVRHYGTLRFAIMAAFLATNAGLFAIFPRSGSGASRFFLATFGLTGALTFAYLQFKLSAIHHRCRQHLEILAENHADIGRDFVSLLFPKEKAYLRDTPFLQRFFAVFGERNPEFLGPITLTVLALHLIVALLWVVLFFCEKPSAPALRQRATAAQFEALLRPRAGGPQSVQHPPDLCQQLAALDQKFPILAGVGVGDFVAEGREV